MPGIHKNNTVSFRPTEWERIMIDEKARLSGLTKKDFIIKSCIYSNISVVGDKRNIQIILDSVEDMRHELVGITSSLTAGNSQLSEEGFCEMKKQYLAMCLALVEILDGAAYLFDRGSEKGSVLRNQEKLSELLDTVNIDYHNGDS